MIPAKEVSRPNVKIIPSSSQSLPLHTYSATTICIAMEFVVKSLSSLRGAMKSFEIMSSFQQYDETPSFVSIQNWLLRFGLYQLQKSIEQRDDWIFILDHTVQIGTQKALVILGITLEQLMADRYKLKHADMQTLLVAITDKTNGEIVNKYIVQAIERVGAPPIQIVADHGSDIKKGVALTCQSYPTIINTYDITHKVASLMRSLLEHDQDWCKFRMECTATRKKVAQTELVHLAPPKQKEKARYLNVDKLIKWLWDIIDYMERGDYSNHKKVYKINDKVFALLSENLSMRKKRSKATQKLYSSEDELCSHIEKLAGKKLLANEKEQILIAADIRGERFLEYFGWIDEYKDKIETYRHLIEVIEIVQNVIKNEGLYRSSARKCKRELKGVKIKSSAVIKIKKDLLAFVEAEGKKAPKRKRILGTSDIIESVIGKYKLFIGNSGAMGIGKMIYLIPVFTTKITFANVSEALVNFKHRNLDSSIKQFINGSINTARRLAFSNDKNGTKPA